MKYRYHQDEIAIYGLQNSQMRDGIVFWLHNTQSFGNNIRLLRRAAGMTQEQVAAQLQLRGIDMSRSSYSQIECGTHSIRVRELIALKEIFGVSYDAFFKPFETE